MSHSIRVTADGAIGWLEIDRPQRANAYTVAMLDALDDGLRSLGDDPGVRVVVVRGTTPGRFCAGADLDELRARGVEDALALRALRFFDALAACPMPTIAAIDGPAIGGGLELALACDLRLASDRARFALPETGFGVIPAAGGTFRLPRLVGPAVAAEVVLFGGTLDANAALACGLVNEVVRPENLEERVRVRCDAAADRAPLAQQLAKQALALAWDDAGAHAHARAAQGALYERNRRDAARAPGDREG